MAVLANDVPEGSALTVPGIGITTGRNEKFEKPLKVFGPHTAVCFDQDMEVRSDAVSGFRIEECLDAFVVPDLVGHRGLRWSSHRLFIRFKSAFKGLK